MMVTFANLTLRFCIMSSAFMRLVLADTNGMDMSMDGAMSLASGNMLSYLHFTLGDVVWFQGWVPRSTGPMIGACIGLVLLAMFERWLSACRSLMDAHWHNGAQIKQANFVYNNRSPPRLDARASAATTSSMSKEKASGESTVSELPTVASTGEGTTMSLPRRMSMSFVLGYDIPRGIVHAAQSALEFAFMLVVMTYQVGFIISIVLGLGVGEALFGRYNMRAHLPSVHLNTKSM